MAKQTYRVIQWATGKVGKVAIQHFVDNPVFELVGVYVTNPEKVNQDAGDIAGTRATGVLATSDIDALIALEADCVHFTPLVEDVELVCRLLRSGKNVVTPLGPFYPTERYKASLDKIAEACEEGGTSFHASGIHPGFAGDLLPLTMMRLMDRVDCIHVHETVDHLRNPSKYIEFMGFGRTPEDVRANPGRDPNAHLIFAQSMAMVVEALGKSIDDVSSQIELATATQDIEYPGGVVSKGTVAGQHYEWTAWSEGKPLVVYHCYWVMGDHIEPRWNCGDIGYRVRVEGNPPLNLSLNGVGEDGEPVYPGLSLTSLLGVNVIPDVCDAQPGIVTHFELGLVKPRGLVRG